MHSETKSAIASAVLHAGALGFALMTFSGTTLEATSPPAMPIDLVSTEEFSRLTKGVKDAPKAAQPKPLVEKKAEQPKPVEEQKPKVVEKKPVEAAKDAAPPPQPEQKPDPIAKKLEKLDKPQAEAKAVKIDRLPPRRPPQKKAQPKLDLDKIAALIDKREPQREAAAGRELNASPSLGASKGTAARLSQSELDALRARLQQCWNPPIGVRDASNMRVVYRVLFKRDGSIAGAPEVVNVQGASSMQGPALVESARRALLQCQPFKMLKPENYETWKDMEIVFDPVEMFRS